MFHGVKGECAAPPFAAGIVTLWPAWWLAGRIAEAGGLAPVILGALAVAGMFAAVWYAVDGHLRSDVAKWRTRNRPESDASGRTD